jgi:hypothetical protein
MRGNLAYQTRTRKCSVTGHKINGRAGTAHRLFAIAGGNKIKSQRHPLQGEDMILSVTCKQNQEKDKQKLSPKSRPYLVIAVWKRWFES